MLIDWFTVGAQTLNFVILVWLLQHFLYKPILNAIDAREESIAAELADAAAKRAEAQTERDDFKRKNEEFDRQRATLWREATEAASAERQKLLDQARKAAADATLKQQEALRAEVRNQQRALSLRVRQEVYAIAQGALTDLAEVSLEARMVDVFVRRLLTLTGKDKDQLASALATSAGPVIVRTTFDLPKAQRASIEAAVKEALSPQAQVAFETTPDLISGIALSAGGHKLSWNIADYLASLEQGVDDLLKEQERPESQRAQVFKLEPDGALSHDR